MKALGLKVKYSMRRPRWASVLGLSGAFDEESEESPMNVVVAATSLGFATVADDLRGAMAS